MTPLITGASDVAALRVIEDRDLLEAAREAEQPGDGYQI